MRIFASNQFVGNLKNSSSNIGLLGAGVATSDFYKNLIRFGEFDEYHFFILPENKQKSNLRKELIPHFDDERLKFRQIAEFPSFLRQGKNFVFFTSTPGIFNIANLRSIYAKRYFPICGATHTISYDYLICSVFFRNMVSDLRSFDSIACTSTSVLASLKRIHRLITQDVFRRMSKKISYKARLDCLPLGINTEDYAKNNKADSRKDLKLPLKKTIILYFGRLSNYDKADLFPLLLVFKNLLSKNKNILLVLAGNEVKGDYGKRLKKIASDLDILSHIRFFFNPSQQEKYSIYAASDIFVSPVDSLQESFGLTVLEAMSSGLPTVVSDWDGYKDIVLHNKTGFFIPTYWAKCDQEISNSTYLINNIHVEQLSLGQSVCIDVKKSIEYLSLLIKNKDLRLKLGSHARERVCKYYDWSVVIPKYERLWSVLIDKAKACKIPPGGIPVFAPRYFECFNHYPSQILNNQTNISITEEGKRLLQTRKFLMPVPALNLITPKIILLILFYLKERQASSIGIIIDHINVICKEISNEKISYHIMWMLKYYLVEIISRRK